MIFLCSRNISGVASQAEDLHVGQRALPGSINARRRWFVRPAKKPSLLLGLTATLTSPHPVITEKTIEQSK